MNTAATRRSKHMLVAGMLAASTLLFGACAQQSNLPQTIRDVAVEPAVSLSGFSLFDHNQRPVTLDSLTGHWTFVFFGFTNCPDVCPATLSQLVVLNKVIEAKTAAANSAGSPAAQFFFVSVDPDRDTPESLAHYIRYFDTAFVGMTGAQSELQALEAQFGVFHRYSNQRSNGYYTVEHSSDTFLIDPKGRIVGRFLPPLDTERVAEQFLAFVDYFAQEST